jgi:uncharacterized coiled-coil DUF342 family protein
MDEPMKQIVAALKPLFNELRDELRTEMHGLRAEMHAGFAKTDQKFDKLGREVSGIRGVTRRTAIQVAKLVGDVSDIKHTMASTMATKDDISLVHSRLDTFLPEILASRRERDEHSDAYMLHQNRLDAHERRLSRLEGRRS